MSDSVGPSGHLVLDWSSLLAELWCRLLVCVSMSLTALQLKSQFDQETRTMLNLGFVTRSTHSPLLHRSKSPRRCPVKSEGTTSCLSASPFTARHATTGNGLLESCTKHAESETVIRKGDSVSPAIQFPTFQQATCPGLPKEISPFSSKCSSSSSPSSSPSPSSSSSSSADLSYRTITPDEVAEKLSSPSNVLILDCRSFIAFNINHIGAALNVSCCDKLTKKRLQCGKVTLCSLVGPGQAAKDEFAEKHAAAESVVLYDDNTEDVHSMTVNNPLRIIYAALTRLTPNALIMKGGLRAFQSDHAHLCSQPEHRPDHCPLFSPTTPVVHSDIDTATATQVLPYLFVGNERDAADRARLDRLGVTHVLNVTSHLPVHFADEGIEYCRLAASDSAHQNLRPYFDQAFQFIEGARTGGGRVLVHCQAGVSRSSTIIIAYLMQYSGLSMTAAFQYVKARRTIIAPNFNFMGQLLEFEKFLVDNKLSRDLPLKLKLSDNVVTDQCLL